MSDRILEILRGSLVDWQFEKEAGVFPVGHRQARGEFTRESLEKCMRRIEPPHRGHCQAVVAPGPIEGEAHRRSLEAVERFLGAAEGAALTSGGVDA